MLLLFLSLLSSKRSSQVFSSNSPVVSLWYLYDRTKQMLSYSPHHSLWPQATAAGKEEGKDTWCKVSPGPHSRRFRVLLRKSMASLRVWSALCTSNRAAPDG